MQHFDLIIIGGGAAGIMAAISAKTHHPNLKVAIIDRTFALGRKLLVSGAGRCNFTNINLQDDFSNHYYSSNLSLVKNTFAEFGYDEIIKFFHELGVETYVERKTNIGKVFPTTDSAKTIIYLLENKLQRLGIEIFLNTEVTEIRNNVHAEFEIKTKHIENLKNNLTELTKSDNGNIENTFICKKLILSAGGKTYEALGSNGSGFKFARSFGHRIITPIPSALPLVSNNKLCKLMSGQKMDLIATSIIEDKIMKTCFDDVMFTDYGLSGPAILNLSRDFSIQINRNKLKDCKIILNFLVHQNGKSYSFEEFSERVKRNIGNNFETCLVGISPNKVAHILAKEFENPKCEEFVSNSKYLTQIFDTLQNFEFEITATRSWNEAEFTAGGIDASEVSNDLESKFVKNLYFAGEIIDVDGDVGGYNLSWAWSSGWLAGRLS